MAPFSTAAGASRCSVPRSRCWHRRWYAPNNATLVVVGDVKDGYVTEVKGGGTYGELWREFLKYPNINELNYPYQDRPGYWWFYEAGLGTNPKFFKRPDENMSGQNLGERNNAGVIHWGFGGSVVHDPDKPEEWAYISKYSPYQNLKPNTKYPKVMFTTTTRDDRVHPAMSTRQ